MQNSKTYLNESQNVLVVVLVSGDVVVLVSGDVVVITVLVGVVLVGSRSSSSCRVHSVVLFGFLVLVGVGDFSRLLVLVLHLYVFIFFSCYWCW